MMKPIAITLALVLLLCGCSQIPPLSYDSQPEETAQINAREGSAGLDPALLFTDRDYRTDYTPDTTVSLTGDSAKVSGSGVRVEGSTLTVTGAGTYLFTGTLTDGMIIVDTDKQAKVQLVLSNAAIHSETSAAIYVRQADKVFLTAEGSNTLSSGGSFTAIDENNIDAAVFSKEDLTLNGTGSLTVTSPAGQGIVSKDELTVTGGSYTVRSASHGISGKDSVCIDGGILDIQSGKDGIQAEHDEDPALGFVYIASGSFTLESEGDGISASGQLLIADGSFSIITGGGSVNGEVHESENWGNMGGRPGGMGPGGMGPGGMGPGGMGPGGMGGNPGSENETDSTEEDSTSIKGLKAGSDLVILAGSFSIDSADDAIHADGNVTVQGGSFTIATGDDGFHANAALTVSAGIIAISESYEGLEGQSILLSGGSITLNSSDDGLNAAGGNDASGFGGFRGGDMFAADSNSFITISGGTLFVSAAGDGIDSNGNLTVTGGQITVEGPTDGANGPLDYAGNAAISGGSLAVTGSMQMAQSVTGDGQGVLGISVGSQTGGTAWQIRDAEGNVLISGQPEKAYSCIVVSCPGMVSGQIYTVTVGSLSGELTAS